MIDEMTEQFKPSIHDLYPHLNDAERAEAEDNLERYLALTTRIFERIESDSNPQADVLTAGTGTLPCTSPVSGSSAQSNHSS